ncbi:CHAT domain-containing protein [Billgrantia montanilacus]|uniref:CHAT domain-containing protein n=1 Tax=Billgrantia montanilacus TaxID=2282305 RepID=A0A368TYI3_9GAMM|nr:CHAT domain-containing protein [Halomonas montanilacus]RCV89830.1 CHAT domain-containing protein [Halomonas montanilacus]
MSTVVHEATFGNKGGSHQLLESTLPGTTPALEELRFLVDRPAGHIDSSVSWSPYWGCQPVGEWWAIWRGQEDQSAARRNMVRARVALVPLAECGNLADLTPLLSAIGHSEQSAGAEFAGTVVERLATTDRPIAIPALSIAPGLLSALWPRLWAGARRELSLRTVFAEESLNIATPPKIALFPSALLARWRGNPMTSQPEPCSSPAGRWFAGEASPQLQRLLEENDKRLPGDLSVLLRLNRLVEKLDALHSGRGTLADALLIVRTQEAFPGGLCLPSEDAEVVSAALLKLPDSSAGEIRTASLTRLEQIQNLDAVTDAVAQWVETRIVDADDQDALWILQHHLSPSHSEWWRKGVSEGLASAVSRASRSLASAIWRWLELRPQAIQWLLRYFDCSGPTESWLASDAPDLPKGPLLDEMEQVCSAMNWPTLLATILRGRRHLSDVVGIVRTATKTPEAGLEAMLASRGASEAVIAAATTGWPPLLDRAAEATREQPQLFCGVDNQPAISELLRRHLGLGGQFPEALITTRFLTRVFDSLLDGDDAAIAISAKLPTRAGGVTLDYDNATAVLVQMNGDVLAGAAEAWWGRFTASEHVAAPPEPIRRLVVDSIRKRTKEAPIAVVIRLLKLLPSIDESSFADWVLHTSFFWEDGDHQRMAQVLEARQWNSAATSFRRSWKQELKLVAWYAQSLLSWSDCFWWPPSGAGSKSFAGLPAAHTITSTAMRITFLAANPLSSSRLALDEEARSIDEKVRDSKHRDLVTFRTRWAVQPQDLQQALLEDEPVVVHFSGHGGGSSGIVLHAQDQGAEHLVAEDALVDLFRVLKDEIRVVVLNACYSEVQAQAIVQEIDFVVGMSDAVADDAARVFAAAFYRGLAFGRSVQTAFDLGINELRLARLGDEDHIPKLLVRSGVDASTAKLVGTASL